MVGVVVATGQGSKAVGHAPCQQAGAGGPRGSREQSPSFMLPDRPSRPAPMNATLAFLTTFGVCAFSAVVPLVNAELYLLAASALAPRELAVPLILAAAFGQMAGKSLMYLAGVGALKLPGERLRRVVAQADARYHRAATGGATLGGGVILLSAIVGLPPFYIVSVACGLLRIPFMQFLVLGLAGRLVRFTVIVLAPQFWKAWA